jgi:hypothetical protein
MTPLDTLFHNSIDNTHQSGHTRISKVRNCTSLLSATLAYLVTLSPHKITREVNADVALQRLMAMVHKKKNQTLPLFIRDLCSGLFCLHVCVNKCTTLRFVYRFGLFTSQYLNHAMYQCEVFATSCLCVFVPPPLPCPFHVCVVQCTLDASG